VGLNIAFYDTLVIIERFTVAKKIGDYNIKFFVISNCKVGIGVASCQTLTIPLRWCSPFDEAPIMAVAYPLVAEQVSPGWDALIRRAEGTVQKLESLID
jgi:hypothetical protein